MKAGGQSRILWWPRQGVNATGLRLQCYMLDRGRQAAGVLGPGRAVLDLLRTPLMPRYGDWASQPEVAHILADFLNNLGGTSWMNINSGYSDSSGNVGTSQVSHGGTCYDPYSHGKSLSDEDILVSMTCSCHSIVQLSALLCSPFNLDPQSALAVRLWQQGPHITLQTGS